jgi:AmiR/NasT family two-component response regulator
MQMNKEEAIKIITDAKKVLYEMAEWDEKEKYKKLLQERKKRIDVNIAVQTKEINDIFGDRNELA